MVSSVVPPLDSTCARFANVISIRSLCLSSPASRLECRCFMTIPPRSARIASSILLPPSKSLAARASSWISGRRQPSTACRSKANTKAESSLRDWNFRGCAVRKNRAPAPGGYSKPARVIGSTTVSSLQSGLYYGYLGLVDGILDRLLEEMGRETTVVATGGLATLIGTGSKHIKHVDDLLTLDGLRLIWERKHPRSPHKPADMTASLPTLLQLRLSRKQRAHPAASLLRAEWFVENYFNYFTEIEEHFQRRRGGALMLSTLDWALIETWKDAGIPLEAALRGIDSAFERYEKRPSKRKVNSLAYCAQEVLAAAEEMKEAAVGVSNAEKPKATGFQTAEIIVFLRRNADQILSAKLARPGMSALALARETASTLREVASRDGKLEHFATVGRSGTTAHRARREIICRTPGGNSRRRGHHGTQ